MEIKVFVSYSHEDRSYLKKNSLLGFLKGLEREGVCFWSDENLVTGQFWDEKIKNQIKETDIAFVLISQAFLNSAYCADVEISGFLNECRNRGLIIFPIILSACEWQRHEWLKSRQFLPRDGKTIEEHFTHKGRRKRLFDQILQDLRKQIEEVRQLKKSQSLVENRKSRSEFLQKKLSRSDNNKPKIRIYKLAKDLNLEVKQVIEDALNEGIQVSKGFNTITLEQAKRIRKKYDPKKTSIPAPPPLIRLDLDSILKQAPYASIISTSPDGTWLLTFYANRSLHLWAIDDLSHHIVITSQNSNQLPTSCAIRLIDNGWELLLGLNNGFERWRIRRDGTAYLIDWIPIDNLVQVQFSPDGTLLLTVSYEGLIKIRKSENGILVQTFICKDNLRTGSFCHGNHYVIAGSEVGRTFLWELTSGTFVKDWHDHHGMPVSTLIGMPSRPHFISAGEDGMLVLRKCSDSPSTHSIALKEAILCATFDKTSGLIFAGLKDKTLLARNIISTNDNWQILLPDMPAALTIIDGRFLVAANYDRTIEIRELRSGHTLATLVGFKANSWLVMSTNGDLTGKGYEQFVGKGDRMFKPVSGHFNLLKK